MAFRMSNEDVSLGDIFVKGFCDEVGYFSSFFKVVEKRGKSIVIVRQVAAETTGNKVNNGVEVKALPDNVIGDEHRLRAYISDDGETSLYEISSTGYYDCYFRGNVSSRTGLYSCDEKKGMVSGSPLEEALPLKK